MRLKVKNAKIEMGKKYFSKIENNLNSKKSYGL
jgi:hypothetical protein